MFLCVPDSYIERMEIMSTLCGSEKVEKPFKRANVIFLTSTKKEENEVEVKEEIKEEPKNEEKVDVKSEVIEEEKKLYPQEDETTDDKEPTANLKPVLEDAITMENRKVCPVKIVPTTKSKVEVKSGKVSDDEGIKAFKTFLEKEGIKYSNIKRVNTGLVELMLPNSTILSVDINDRLYGIGRPVAFVGKMKPLDEYNTNRTGFILNKETVNAIKKGQIPAEEFLIPEEKKAIYSEIDINTLEESDFSIKVKVIEKAHNAIKLQSEEIQKDAAGTPVRFAFSDYKSIDDFRLISSSKTKISSLCNDTLRTDKTIVIGVKGRDISIIR